MEPSELEAQAHSYPLSSALPDVQALCGEGTVWLCAVLDTQREESECLQPSVWLPAGQAGGVPIPILQGRTLRPLLTGVGHAQGTEPLQRAVSAPDTPCPTPHSAGAEPSSGCGSLHLATPVSPARADPHAWLLGSQVHSLA